MPGHRPPQPQPQPGGAGLRLRLLALILGGLLGGSAGVRALHNPLAEAFAPCPADRRLAPLTGLQVGAPHNADGLTVRWTRPDPRTWHLHGYEAEVTILLDGPDARIRRSVSPTVGELRLPRADTDRDWLVQAAVTRQGHVISDIAQTTYRAPGSTRGPANRGPHRTGEPWMPPPRFHSPFFWQGRDHYDDDRQRPVGTFYYLGFGPDFDNWHVDTNTDHGRNPYLPLRIGLRHTVPPPDRFHHFRLFVTDMDGDNVLGFSPATRPEDRDGTVLALGDWLARDCQPQDQQPFANLRRDDQVPAHQPNSPVDHYWPDTSAAAACPGSPWPDATHLHAPRIHIGDDPDNPDTTLTRLAFVNPAAPDTRTLHALPPDHSHTLNLDRAPFVNGETYLLLAWPEDEQNQLLGDEALLELRWRDTRHPLGFGNLIDHGPRPRRTQRTATGTPLWVMTPAETLPPDHALLAHANTSDQTAFSGRNLATADLADFRSEDDPQDPAVYRMYRNQGGTWVQVPLQWVDAPDRGFHAVDPDRPDTPLLVAPAGPVASRRYGDQVREPAGPVALLDLLVIDVHP